MNLLQSIENKINAAKDLDFGTIFNNSIELFKKSWLQGFLLQLFVMLIMLPIIIIVYIPIVMAAFAQAESGVYDNTYSGLFAGFSILSSLLFFVAIILLSAVTMCMQAAFYKILKKLDDGDTPTTKDFFIYLKSAYLSKGLVLSLASVVIAFIAAMLCYLPLFYAMVPLSFFAAFFGFNTELSAGDIIKASFKLGTKKWLIGFGLLIVSSLLATIVGYLACGIGLLFTSAFIYHPVYFMYKEVIGFDDTDEIDEIGLLEE